MKHLLITTIAAVVLVGCGESTPEISIYKAAETGNIEVIKQHLATGVNVNAKNKYGRTPLHYAAGEGHKEIAELLIGGGADVNAQDRFGGETPLDVAIMKKEIEIGALLSSHGGKTGEELKAGEPFAEAAKPERQARKIPERRTRKVPDTIHRAAVSGNIQAVKKHLAAGTDVNAKDDIGLTPLHYAATKEVAELLIAKGADVNAKSKVGVTPLDLAILRNNKDTAELLSKHGGKTGEELKAEGK